MKNLFIFLILNVFCLNSFAYKFSIYCEQKDKDKFNIKLECALFYKNKNKQEEVGSITMNYVDPQKNLFIGYIKIDEQFRKRNLSNILLYHGIKFVKETLGLAPDVTLELKDESSVRKETDAPHYIRYGFQETEKDNFKMPLGEFLNNPKNKERYERRFEKDKIKFLKKSPYKK